VKRRAAVVGAGIVGRLASLKLARRGHAVTLYDQGDFSTRSACSFAAAGLLAPVAEAVAAADRRLHDFGQLSRALWKTLGQELGVGPFPQSAQGSLALARAGDQTEVLELKDRIARLLPGARVQTLSSPELARLEPAFAGEAMEGLFLPDEGHVDARAVLAMLAMALEKDPNVTLRLRTTVNAVGAGVVETADQVEPCDVVVDARGLGASRDLPRLRGVRGEIIEVRAPEVRLTRPVRALHQRYPIYVVPRGADRYVIGATSIESDSLAPVTVKTTLELLGAAYALHSGFRYAEVTELVANARPAFDDHWPAIHAEPGLVRINGLFRHGFLFSPLVVEAAMRLIVNGIEKELPEPKHLADLLDDLGFDREGVAVALNRDFVPRRQLATTGIKDGDQVEVLAPMSGG
jgi:glycine oxidase